MIKIALICLALIFSSGCSFDRIQFTAITDDARIQCSTRGGLGNDFVWGYRDSDKKYHYAADCADGVRIERTFTKVGERYMNDRLLIED